MRDILSLVGEIMKAIVIYNSYVSFRLIYGLAIYMYTRSFIVYSAKRRG